MFAWLGTSTQELTSCKFGVCCHLHGHIEAKCLFKDSHRSTYEASYVVLLRPHGLARYRVGDLHVTDF